MQKVITVNVGDPLGAAQLGFENVDCILLVCDIAYEFLPVREALEAAFRESGKRLVPFSDFAPNPAYESVEAGVSVLKREGCGGILAVGGGSAIDVAKCIALYENLDAEQCYLDQEITGRRLPFAVFPTTAGTGSEATQFAVIYYRGEKQSVAHASCIPDRVVFCPQALATLPLYQKKATLLDAFSHAIESLWSVRATEESRALAERALGLIMLNYRRYLAGDEAVFEDMFRAAYLAGQAINLTQTTAGHAMSYKLTSLYHIAHGHAAALCLSALLPYAYAHAERSVLTGGEAALRAVLARISRALGCDETADGVTMPAKLLSEFALDAPQLREEDIPILVSSVNPVRLKNNPFRLERSDFEQLYRTILK